MNFITHQNSPPDRVTGTYINDGGEAYYCIANCQLMPEFFMVPVSANNHWMFVSSFGAISAGRRSPDLPLFPYYSADKIADLSDCTGPKTLIRIARTELWEPFAKSSINKTAVIRNLYKNILGNRVCFEEINLSRQLLFRYCWTFGNKYGFVRDCELLNFGDHDVEVSLLDGLENIMPYGLDRNFQLRYSNLGDAYKKNELVVDSRLGLFYLSSIPSDRAEPSEGLRATTVWQHGLNKPAVLLSAGQLDQFKLGKLLQQETDVRARRGTYLVHSKFGLAPGESRSWTVIANPGNDQTDVINLNREIIESADIRQAVRQDVAQNEQQLKQIVASADGWQVGSNRLRTHRHQSNALFNVMRGGYPADGYYVNASGFGSHVKQINRQTFDRHQWFLESLPAEISIADLNRELARQNDLGLLRIGLEYLPFSFSRRHGDPSRPWNAFSIDLANDDGSPRQSYEGNWRDIFQNWEAISLAYPEYAASMVFRFVNASTADGYNPYRITTTGFEWESPEPDDPWANIGYWGDHQIVYLLKLLEWSRGFNPEKLDQWLNVECCAYANVPYRIRSYLQIKENPHETIDFDLTLEKQTAARVAEIGSDGKLLTDSQGKTHKITLGEKLLLPALVKMTNFVPEGGIWLNTQRPEWNDANNALVGHGLSMVTVYHLRRFFRFMSDWFSTLPLSDTITVSTEVFGLLKRILEIFQSHEDLLAKPMDNVQRRRLVDALSSIGSDYRKNLYNLGFSGAKEQLSLTAFVEFFEQSLKFIDHTIRANRRDDGLYHSYNLLEFAGDEASIEHLDEMLEGQVAVLSSAALTADEAVDVLEALRQSAMYREDQRSYMLYPDRELPRFIEKNRLNADWITKSKLVKKLVEEQNVLIIKADSQGNLHFNGDFRNANDLNSKLDNLAQQSEFAELVNEERDLLNQAFEETFHHRRFTGRSSTFFGYEGLGSIYWHMVSKLSLATMENLVWANEDPATDRSTLNRLRECYREIQDGIGVEKSPELYGAFPFDPYSHTPRHAGAQQPGMTGQVKEDILARYLELGLRIGQGVLRFDPKFFETHEFLLEPTLCDFINVDGESVKVELPPDSFALSLCQVPIIYIRAQSTKLLIQRQDGGVTKRTELALSPTETAELYSRSGAIVQIEVFLCSSNDA